MNTGAEGEIDSLLQPEDRGSNDLRSAEEKGRRVCQWRDSVTVLPSCNPHARLRAHKKLFVCIAISLHHIDVRNSVCNPFLHFFFKKQTKKLNTHSV